MQSVAAYYVVAASDIARQHRQPARNVAIARPSRVTRVASAIAGIIRPEKAAATQPA